MVNIGGERNELTTNQGNMRSVRPWVGSAIQTELLVELEGAETTLSAPIESKRKVCLIKEGPCCKSYYRQHRGQDIVVLLLYLITGGFI